MSAGNAIPIRARARRSPRPKRPTEADIAADFEAQPPQFTEQEIFNIERKFVDDASGILRRMALASLARSGGELRDAVIDDRAAALDFAKVCNGSRDYAARLREFAGLMETASMRLMIGMCFRDDGPEILEEGKCEPEKGVRS
jgi:hypothetical protein